ncbi:serine hydrolase domain-containing protein [Catellatospora sp. KI3]|uniref:serine hydrolase domain-containing protein n=1 Tax=Catellatospora sp. KI3 TaxID=3041620 RepID=UPI002482A157|nr:serine hydrolase domain-containing protein [Catellatospora sp. KI3]MDI1463296.1 serine hydrolase domain-containing protein [Catellatospora sp. KI3]
MIESLWSGDRWQRRLRAAEIHSLVVQHAGRTECAWFRRHGGDDRPVNLHSVTKSITGSLAGPDRLDLGSSVLSHLPHVTVDDQRKHAITVEHLLAMTSGLRWPEWEEWGGYARPMTGSSDQLRTILAPPLVAEPGTAMWYSSGSSHLLGAVLRHAVGHTVAQLAEQCLFKPLRIRQWRFHADRHGYSHAGYGLSLRPTDLARLGSGLLSGDLVPAEWLRQCWQPRTYTYPHVGAYGWHWWVDTELGMVFAFGKGGQLLALFPAQELVIVMTGDAYGDATTPLRLIREAHAARSTP